MMKLFQTKIHPEKKRIGQTLKRWLRWSIIGSAFSLSAMAATPAPATNCVSSLSSSGLDLSLDGFPVPNSIINTLWVGDFINPEGMCVSGTPFTGGSVMCTGDTLFIQSNVTFYIRTSNTATDLYCDYAVTLTPTAASAMFLPAALTPTAVPIFTPIGIIATISGLLWFGRRRKSMNVTTG